MGAALELAVDARTCISSGYCRRALPEVFGADEQRKAVLLRNPVEDGQDVWDAMEGCPVEAITARSTDTGQTVFP